MDFVIIFAGKTLDGPPSSPPIDVRVGVINNTAAWVRWSKPPVAMMNGELTGYIVSLAYLLFFFARTFHQIEKFIHGILCPFR